MDSISDLFSEPGGLNIREFHLYTIGEVHHAMFKRFSNISVDKMPNFIVFGDCKKLPYFSYPVSRFIRHLSVDLPEKLTKQNLLLKDGTNTLVSTASFFTPFAIFSPLANTDYSCQQANDYDQPRSVF